MCRWTDCTLGLYLNSASRSCNRLTARVRVMYFATLPAFPCNKSTKMLIETSDDAVCIHASSMRVKNSPVAVCAPFQAATCQMG